MQGRIIVFEGIDGSGKSTQFEKLCQRLSDEGQDYHKLIFPRYEEESSALIRMYLDGKFGKSPGDVNPYAASAFFAVDRYASYQVDWKDHYLSGGTVLSDRYTTANAVHQGAKLEDGQREEYFGWLYDFEFRLMELPSPDMVIYMDLPLEKARALMAARQRETRTRGDIHETNWRYLERCLEAGAQAADYYGWQRISCVKSGKMRAIEDIHEEIYQLIKGAL